jgi:hypothetical protein
MIAHQAAMNGITNGNSSDPRCGLAWAVEVDTAADPQKETSE